MTKKFRLAFPQFKASTAVDAEYLKQIEKARRELRLLIINEKCAPLMLRLALYDAGTYDANKRTGGPDGSIKYELNRDENVGLDKAVQHCQKVKDKCPKVSYADLYQLAGVVAVEVMGGPTIDFVPGRQDSDKAAPAGRLPDAEHADAEDAKQGASYLRKVFYRMGLTDKDIVALSGSYTLAQVDKAQADRERLDFGTKRLAVDDVGGTQTENQLKFDNSYFVKLLGSEASSMLSTDKALVDDPEFRKYAERYKNDEEAFFADYAASHKKLSELGFNRGDNRIAHGVIGIFIASTMLILGYLFERNRRSKQGNY